MLTLPLGGRKAIGPPRDHGQARAGGSVKHQKGGWPRFNPELRHEMQGDGSAGVCVECGQACAVVVQDQRAVSACCGANALEDGGLFIIAAAELPPCAPAVPKQAK